jgi:cytochrome c oxidase cbb3-type subunit 4
VDWKTVSEGARSLWVVWLVILFAVVVWWAYRPKNRKKFEDAAKIPFREDNGGS